MLPLCRFSTLAVTVLALAAGCSGRAPAPKAQLSPRTIEATPVVLPPPPKPVPPPPPPRVAVAILATAGLHGRITPTLVPPPPGTPPRNPGLPPITTGGLARRATIVDRARVAAAAVLQVDAGDFLPLASDDPRDAVAPTSKDVPRWREAVLEGYHRLGVAAVTMGARDLLAPGLDPRQLVPTLEKAKAFVVLANLVDKDDASVFAIDRTLVVGGTQVGVFGVATMAEGDRLALLKKTGWTLRDPAGAAREVAAELRRGGAKLVVALVNIASGASAAELLDGADVDVAVVSGGDVLPRAPLLGKRPLMVRPADPFALVDEIDVRLSPAGAPTFEPRTIPLATDVPEQHGVGLISRVLTTKTFDGEKLLAEQSKKKHIAPGALRDLYEAWDFASTKACGYCHEKQLAQWQTTDHAHAFATLAGNAKNPKTNHAGDPACLGCHVMGWVESGGTRDLAMARTQFADVGCESCHGPSALHVRSPNKKMGTSRKVDPVVCLGCHTPDWSDGFDPVASMKDILGPGHGMPELKK